MTSFDHRRLDRVIHSRIRLSIMAILASVEDAEFTYIRDQVRTTDGNLGTHLRRLEDAAYVQVEKSFVNRKPVSRYRITEAGRTAFQTYVDSLEEMLHVPVDIGRRSAG